jgi:hypothetical protein
LHESHPRLITFIFQTKGLSLEQIDDMYQEIYPWQSHVWRRRNVDAVTAGEKESSHEEPLDDKEKA